jgi:hypothetical protein
MMTGSEREDEFETYLKRRVRIDRRLRSLDRLEPPAELDRIIIGHARDAIRAAPPAPLFRAPRWALPLGMAATILISLSVLLDLGVRDAVRNDAGRPAAMARAMVPESGMPPDLASDAPAPAAIQTAPWSPLPRTQTAEGTAARAAASDEPASTSDAGPSRPAQSQSDQSQIDASARNRVSERFLATDRLRTAEASDDARAVPMPARWQAEAHMAVVTVIGTRIHQ